jgi:hypothetical protein
MNSPLATLLADTAAADLGTWIQGAATITQLGLTVIMLATINSKQKREVYLADEYATRDEVDSLKDELSKLDVKIESVREKVAEVSERAATLSAQTSAVNLTATQLTTSMQNLLVELTKQKE